MTRPSIRTAKRVASSSLRFLLPVMGALRHRTMSDSELEEGQLCTSCGSPNSPSAHFCVSCGAPLSSYAGTGPFESTLAEGFIYRQATARPRSLIVVIGMRLMFGSMALAGAITIVVRAGTISEIIGAAVAAISVITLWKTTGNYLTGKKADRKRGA